MPQLDFLLYSYQFIILFIVFFLLYDLILNYWLPAFLCCHYIIERNNRRSYLNVSYTSKNLLSEQHYYAEQIKRLLIFKK